MEKDYNEDNIDKERGARIKELRIKKGLTQEELANKIYVSKQMISKYEQGEGLGYKAAKSLAIVFNVSDEYLMKGTISFNNINFNRIDNELNKYPEMNIEEYEIAFHKMRQEKQSIEKKLDEIKISLAQEQTKNEALEKENAWLKGLVEKAFGGPKT